ncbi:uncharacterized protein [Rutidosis leptorrhynchoides]|uniref:uncharacterized protein isoform X2 n=1 Tax=Rutidosis leptorrhynchoides TaxID=125765 RepID=UPI003A99DF25
MLQGMALVLLLRSLIVSKSNTYEANYGSNWTRSTWSHFRARLCCERSIMVQKTSKLQSYPQEMLMLIIFQLHKMSQCRISRKHGRTSWRCHMVMKRMA